MLQHMIGMLRKNTGMSQAQLAEKLNVSASTVGMYEQGRREPNVSTLISIAKLFDVSLDYLITGAEYKCRTEAEECPCTTCYWRGSNVRK